MQRSEFIRKSILGFIGLMALGPEKSIAKPVAERIYSLGEIPVAGFQYYKGERISHLLKEGTNIQLKREPENKYDSNAIALYCNDVKIGFVPRDDNYTMALLLDQNAPLSAQITNVDLQAGPWERVWVEVVMGEKEIKE